MITYIITIKAKEYEWSRHIADRLTCDTMIKWLKPKSITVENIKQDKNEYNPYTIDYTKQ